jgi:glycosyltransferase involved in cell wall biosynthesis
LRAFAPEKIEKYEVLSFAATPADENGNLPTIDDLKAKYLFSGSYFLLPNQFWVHKNHQVVVKALGYLKQQGSPVLVIATGNTQDSRHPEHFKGLMQEVTALAVEDCFKVLGIVPKADLAALMKYAIAVINPSLFEGWSTTVEEAKYFYKPIILSDIPVHREQNPLLATYFSPGNASELAKKLWQIWNQPEENMKKTIELTLSENNKRRFEFARKYQEIVLKTLKQ